MALKPRFIPPESRGAGVFGHTLDGDEGVVAAFGVEMPRYVAASTSKSIKSGTIGLMPVLVDAAIGFRTKRRARHSCQLVCTGTTLFKRQARTNGIKATFTPV